ncbi:MAG: hypothetical protein JJE37_08735 [Methyloceanibacter sp.]|nr:hypothetical protein [Methyloceanibacter sp.]
MLLTTGYALAGQMTSGRPSAVLTPEQCQEVWSKAVPTGDALAKKDAVPYIVNFKLVDTDHNGQISKSEFDFACTKGLVKYTKH